MEAHFSLNSNLFLPSCPLPPKYPFSSNSEFIKSVIPLLSFFASFASPFLVSWFWLLLNLSDPKLLLGEWKRKKQSAMIPSPFLVTLGLVYWLLWHPHSKNRSQLDFFPLLFAQCCIVAPSLHCNSFYPFVFSSRPSTLLSLGPNPFCFVFPAPSTHWYTLGTCFEEWKENK